MRGVGLEAHAEPPHHGHHRIVEEHHGRVTVENRPQNGALVTLYFPLEGITN